MMNLQARSTGAEGKPANKMLSLVVVAKIRLYREGLALALRETGRFEVLAAVSSIHEALDLTKRLRPGVVLFDVADGEGPAAIEELVGTSPETRVVALGIADSEQEILRCAELGVAGYVLRDGSIEELIATLEAAARQELRCSPRFAAALFRRVAALSVNSGTPFGQLTLREKQVLRLIDEGLSNKDIASHLYIELATVKNHVHHILDKLQTRTRGEAAAQARAGGHF